MLARPGNIASIDIGNRQREQAAAARLLVMGAEGVGKSAAIVRFTTGRFIHQYCPSTQDWLYKHQLYCQQENLPPGAIQIELLEQKEANCREDSSATSETNQPQSSLALRVASDQRADRELRECQQLLDKLQWANACVIVYSLTSSDSFAKAREYLDLLDWMYTNRALPSNQTDQQSIRHKVEQRLTGGGGGRRHLALPISQQQCRPPVLLLGNKHDLASSCPGTRQVTLEQGHELAVQHKCLFAELSVSGCANSIRNVLFDLIGRVLPTTYAPEPQQHSVATSPPLTQLVKWQANPPNLSTSIKTQLIKTQMPLVSSSHSTQVAGSLNEVATTTRVPRQPPVAAATCRPLVTSSYSDPRQVAVAQCSAAMVVAQSQAASKQSGSPTNASRYGALKSTFKKASLAIVGGKALASRASTGRNSTGDAPSMAPVTALKRNSTTSSNLSELVSEHSFSVRGSIGSLSSSSTTAPAAGHTTTTHEQAPPVVPPPSKLNKSSNWIKSRFARQESSGSEGKSSQSAIVSNTCELQSLQPEEQVASGKFKRPLFKYKNRLRTVGFEPSFSSSSSGNNRTTGPTTKQSSESIQTITTGSLDGATGAQQQQPPRQTRASGTASPLSSSLSSSSRSSAPNAPPTHDANRCSSGRSSSSLSASDTYYSSLFVVCQAANNQPPPEQCAATVSPCRHAPSPPQPPPPPGGANQRQDSRSTLSRASTSLGSYDEMLEDMESAASDCTVPPPQPATTTATVTPPGRKISADSKPPVCATAGLKTRFQVVKSVQSTLTSLAKSTRATVTPAQHPAVKRSFCSALMSSSMSLASPRVCESAIAPVQQVAKIEAIRAIPAVLGYCK